MSLRLWPRPPGLHFRTDRKDITFFQLEARMGPRECAPLRQGYLMRWVASQIDRRNCGHRFAVAVFCLARFFEEPMSSIPSFFKHP